ncbi:MAG: hypothetical protein J5493_08235 [Lachnospiraceae bacterium]|nr:hypothetical protein [Lachnospiraceae bacterium]
MTQETMQFESFTGEEMAEAFLEKIMDIDRAVYEERYVGCLENMQARFRAERKSFVCIRQKGSDDPAGYINFFPVCDELWDDITESGSIIRDDDIMPDELVPYGTADDKGYNLFIISVVVLPEYRGSKDAVITLTDGFRDYLLKLEGEGHRINAIAGTAVSDDGKKFMYERFFYLKREVKDLPKETAEDNTENSFADKLPEEEPDQVYVCDGDFLDYFLAKKNNRYKKGYKNDLYLIIPFSCNEDGFKGFPAGAAEAEPEGNDDDAIMTRKLLTCLKEDLIYECSPELTSGITHYYLGSCRFLFSFDEYPRSFESRDEKTYFYGEEKAHLIMMADLTNKLFNLLIFIPNNRFSPSGAGDQMSQSFLPVRKFDGGMIVEDDHLRRMVHNRNRNGNPASLAPSDIEYYDLHELMHYLYGLIPCGQGKSLVSSSAFPPEEETGCILAGETYMSVHQDFRIKKDSFLTENNVGREIYDYYKIYLSERTVIFVEEPNRNGKSKSGLFDVSEREQKENDPERRNQLRTERLNERIATVTTYTFIMEIVTFRNTALQKVIEKVSAAILQDGDVSYKYVQTLYRDFARTDKYADKRNFRYFGTQKEAQAILEAFGTEELEKEYREKQKFLEHYIELSSAIREKRTAAIVGIGAAILSVLQVKDFFSDMIGDFASATGVPISQPNNIFYRLILSVTLFYILIMVILHFRNRRRREDNLIETYRNKYGFTESDDDRGSEEKQP